MGPRLRVQSSSLSPFATAEPASARLADTRDLEMRQESPVQALRPLPLRQSKLRSAMVSSAPTPVTRGSENALAVRPESELPTLELVRMLHTRLEASELTPTEVSSPPAYSEGGRRG